MRSSQENQESHTQGNLRSSSIDSNEIVDDTNKDNELREVLQLRQVLKRGLRDKTPLGTVVQNKSVRLDRRMGLAIGKLAHTLGVTRIHAEGVATSFAIL